MNNFFHTPRQYRCGLASPANVPQTVGNSQIIENAHSTFMFVMWRAFCHQVAQNLSKILKPLTHPHAAPLVPVYRIESPSSESGEGVGAAVTTTYAYDNNGNLTSAGNGTATTTYVYDYANRLVGIFAGGASTIFGYDAFGSRVYQIASTTATTTYPFKFFSVASTTRSSNNFATSTEYVFNGDTLLFTIDQSFKNGAATGTAALRYAHPDHLGSTDVVTDQNQALVQTLDYYPYGGIRISVSTSTNVKRKFINRFADDSGLDYLTNRYYSSDRGQFISQDPMFWSQKQNLANPQTMNSYSYADDNPISKSDPDGLLTKDSPTNIVRNLLSSLIQLSNSIAAYANSFTHNPTQSIQNMLLRGLEWVILPRF